MFLNIWSMQSSRPTVCKLAERVWIAGILARRKFTKKPVPSSADGYTPFPSLIGEFERPDHIIMAFQSLTGPFFADFVGEHSLLDPKVKLMTGRKCQNFRLLGVAMNL
jgi:hypothetical protein